MTSTSVLDRMGMFLFPWGKTPPSSAQLISAAKEVEALGLDSVHLPYFLALDTETWPWGNESVVDAMPLMPYVLSETERVRASITHWSFSEFHPYFWAQYISTLAHAAPGRVMTTVALGRRTPEFQVGMSPQSEAEQRMLAGFEVFDLLMRGERVPDELSSMWDVAGLRIDPAPPSDVEIWVNGKSAVEIEAAARWAHYLKPTGVSPHDVRTQLKPMLDDAAAAHGRQVRIAMSTLVHVTRPSDDPEWLRTHIEPLLEHERPGGAHGETHVYGTAEQCAEQIEELYSSGVDYIALDMHFHGWEDLKLGMEQLHRLVEDVVPLLSAETVSGLVARAE
ncbi:LLM class flavin-dependent oxidoreductase [Microbacterium soli]|uniref:Luciferase-like domain-containing protein n=1 Tax=Microbacterium soli TaxID=446075 RepID=A0ABP7MXI7_9MICO